MTGALNLAPISGYRLNNLTVARFAAALLVVFHHGKVLQNPAVIDTGWIRNFLHNGYAGVTFFFVLSGFVIGLAHYDEFRELKPRLTLGYFSKRLIRIVPLWLFLSLPFIIIAFKRGDSASLYRFLTFTQAWDPDVRVAFGYLTVAWTLSCEMFFYAMFPLIAWLLHRLQRLWRHSALVFAILCVTASLGIAFYFSSNPHLSALPISDPNSPHRWLYRFPPARLLEFSVGVSLFVWFSENSHLLRSKKAKSMWKALTATSLASIFLLMALCEAGPLTYTAAYLIPFACLVVCLAAIETNESPSSITFPGLILLGEASYALYLVHKDFHLLTSSFQSSFPILDFLWGTAFTLLISIGLFSAIERPSRKFLLAISLRFFYGTGESQPSKQITTADTARKFHGG